MIIPQVRRSPAIDPGLRQARVVGDDTVDSPRGKAVYGVLVVDRIRPHGKAQLESFVH